MTNKEYGELVSAQEKRSPLLKNCLFAFLIGGSICTIGQGLRALFTHMGMDKDATGTAVCISLIFLSALLTGLGVYDNVAKVAGAGTLVPITGFANAMVSPAMEFRSEGLILGVGARLFSIAGPVLVYGISASMIYGFILLIIRGSAKAG